jgi:hypothetical protein
MAGEHIVIHLIDLIRWLDRQFHQPLRGVVPDLDRLLADPGAVLAARDVTIGPARRYASGVCLGLLLGFVNLLWIFPLVALLVHPPGAAPAKPPPLVDLLFLALLLTVLIGSVLLVLRYRRGGSLTLKASGVEFQYRKTVVSCPWALFNAAGQPFRPGPGRLLLPVAAAAVPFVEARTGETLKAAGSRVKTRQLRFNSGSEATLQDLYRVDALEWGWLLLRVGRVLGTALPDGPAQALDLPRPEAAEVPPATAGRDGWLTASLTRLAFPPFCCDCGTATIEHEEFWGYRSLFRIPRLIHVEGADSVRVRVPVCAACQAEHNRRYWRALFRGMGTGATVPLAVGLGLAVAFENVFIVFMFLPAAFFGAVIGALVGRAVAQRRTPPVRLRNYSPRYGTVDFRFQWPEYAERVLALMQSGAAPPARVG